MKISRLVLRTVALAGLAIVGAGAANAQGITVSFIGPVTGAPGDFSYNYQFFLQPQTKVQAGDVITFYDFNGLLTGGGHAPSFVGSLGATYSITTPLLGIDPPGTAKLAGDDPTLPNVSLTYTGPTISNLGNVSQGLGTVTIQSTNGPNVGGDFTPYAASSTNTANNSPAGNQSFVTGPNTPVVTPEPGTWALLVGMGISGGVFARRRNRRK